MCDLPNWICPIRVHSSSFHCWSLKIKSVWWTSISGSSFGASWSKFSMFPCRCSSSTFCGFWLTLYWSKLCVVLIKTVRGENFCLLIFYFFWIFHEISFAFNLLICRILDVFYHGWYLLWYNQDFYFFSLLFLSLKVMGLSIAMEGAQVVVLSIGMKMCSSLCHGAHSNLKAMVIQKEYEWYSYGSHHTKSCPHNCQS